MKQIGYSTAPSILDAEYHDRWIRDQEHFCRALRYIENNPVKARLCAKPSDWPLAVPGFANVAATRRMDSEQRSPLVTLSN
jgi:hypothetical protein